MAVGVARRVWQEGVFIGAFLLYGAIGGYAIIQSGFDVTSTAFVAVSGLVMGSDLFVWAARARHTVVMVLYLAFVVVLLGVASGSLLAHTGGTPGAVGSLASLWLAVCLRLVLKWRCTRPRHPPPY